MAYPVDPKLAINFAVVVQAGSITAGARTLGVAQPWLSEQMRKLEEQVGERLLIRTSRRMELTEAGVAFHPYALALHEANGRAQDFAQRLRRSADQVVQVGATHFTIGFPERVRLFDAYQQRNPGALLQIENGRPVDLIERLKRGELDIVLAHDGAALDSPELLSVGLGRRLAHILAPRVDPLANRGSVQLEELAGRTFAVSPGRSDPGSRVAALAPLRAVGALLVSAPDEDRTIIEHFALREGLPCLRWSLARLPRTELGEQVLIPIDGDPLSTEISIFRRAADQRGRVHRFVAAAEETQRLIEAEYPR